MDDRLRKLERQAASGDEGALHRLFVEHIRSGMLKPVNPGIAEYKKQQAQQAAKEADLRERVRGNKRMTAAQRKRARLIRNSKGRSTWPQRRLRWEISLNTWMTR